MRVFKTILLSTIITTVTLGTALPLAIIYTKKNATFLIKFQDDRSNLKGRGDKIDLNVYSNGRLYDNVYYKNDEVTKEYIKIEGNSIYCIKNPTQALNDIYISAYDKKTNKFLVKTTIGIDVDIIKWHSYSSSMSVGDEQKLIAESTTNGKIGYKVVGTLPSEVTFNAVTGEIKYVTATKTNTTVTIEASSNNGCTSSVKIVILSPSASQDNISWGTYKSSMSVGDKQTITATSSNSGKITYKTIGTVPPEVTFDATKGEIDYKTAVATNTFITIQSDSDKGGTAQIEITILAPVAPQDNISWGTYKASMSAGDKQTITATSSNSGKITYKTIGAVPPEVTFDATKGEIDYKTAVATNTFITIQSDSDKGGTAQIEITILSSASSQDNISWGTYKASMSAGDKQTITAVSSNSGKITYKAIGTMPPEVTFDTTKGEIDYKTAVATNTFITIQSDSDKGGTAQMKITILAPVAPQDNISWGTYKASMSAGDKQTITAVSSNSGKITYKAIGTMPSEVTFDATKGEIDYKTAVATNTFITIQSDSDKGGTAQMRITILAPSTQDNIVWSSYMSAMSYTNSQTLSAASSTKGKITYSVIGATPTGVTFDTDTGILTYKNSMAVLSTIEIRATSSHGGQGDILISFLPVPSNHAIYIKNPASGDTDYSISVPVSTSKTFYFALDNAGASIYYSYALRAPMSHMQIADFNGHYKDATTGNYWASITLVADATGQGQNYLENLLIVASNYSSGETFSNSNWTTVSIPI